MKSFMLDTDCAIPQNGDLSNWEFNTKTPNLSSNRQTDTSTYTIGTLRYQTYFQNSRRSNNSYNLKSNIFDKMLTEEMLIIQQNLHRKDINQLPLHISTGNNAPTPTLEVKQKWSVMNFLSNAMALNESHQFIESKRQNETDNKINTYNEASQSGDKYKQICCNNSGDKIVELRSLNDIITPDTVTSEYLENGRICTCMNTNTHTRCNHRCTAPNTNYIQALNSQEHPQPHSNTDHLCSRTITNQDTQPIIPFYVTTEMYNLYTVTPYPIYYPWIITDVAKKKYKHRKKKPHLDGMYYDNSEEDSRENTDYDDEKDIEKIKYEVNSSEDEKQGKSKGKNVVINVEYEDQEIVHKEKSDPMLDDVLEQGDIQVSNKDKFTEQIVSDLNKYYNDVVIKDCSCSLANGIIIRFQCFICIFLVMTNFALLS